MSNTSLKPIKIPALGHANFGKAIMEQFANIDANFQKLSNFELNAGIPGKSCLYVTINLAAPFVYPTSDVNNPDKSQEDYNAWLIWASYDKAFERELQGTWTQLKDSVAADYEQFRKLTGLREFEYAMIAAKMLWGYTQTFTGSSVEPTSESLTGSLHTKYGAVEGPVECEDSNGTKTTYYGNWLREMFMMGKADYDVIRARAELFKKHVRISVPGRIVVAISPSDEGVAYYPVGSLEYWYIDPRFRNSAVNRDDTNVYDMSCVMHWTPEGKIDDISWPGHFEILEIFPTIRRGEDGKYYWFINGMNTGVPVQGPAGKDGTSAKLVVVQRVENVLGYHPETHPNGKLAVGPLVGDWNVPMSAFAGDSPRNLPSRTQYVNDMPTIVPQWVVGDKWPGWPENLIPAESNAYSRTTSFKLHIDAGLAWLSNNQDGFVLNEPENYFRIYRIVGREIFWTGPEISDDDAKKDPVNHLYDPSCDEHYFGENHVSMPSDSASIQQLIEQLDGATAIVLPGPAYQYDRTDSTYWITTLRKVEWRDPKSDINSRSGRYMLMAYCSDEERVHNSLDEHTQAGMMQRLDAYSYKKNGDNRNKPRGLMLPIGSAYAAYTDGDFDWAWASHVVHSDCGGFTSITNDLRGVQQVLTPAKKLTVATDAMHNVTGQAVTASEAQYTEIVGKRILHIGSVNDYRALNYVDNNTNGKWNGGVPGREELPQNLKGKIGNADFYGKTGIDGWFIGSELHVDEPMTITRYRDLHKRQRLLNVEGDVVIGPRVHANGPDFKYRNRDGGLVVHSTISPDTGRDRNIFPKDGYDITSSIFNENWYAGLELIHRGFHRELLDAGKQNWQYRFNRWMYDGDHYRSFYDVDGRTISTTGPITRSTDKHMFSILGDDGIGARVMVAQDGFVVYNPNGLTVADGRLLTAFSVDAMGNIQTTGSEVRSNADDTLWVFHSRWTGPQNSYADLQADGETISWDWLNTERDGNIKDMVFTIPGHNQLMFGTDHEVQFVDSKHDSLRRLARSWRATNFYPWKDNENTTLGLVPMGWIFNFGPLDNTGFHMRTFMQKRNGEFGQTWGSNELMPVITVISPDVNHYHGVHHVMGIDCMAVRSKAKEIDHAQNNYISGRYGSQIAHGLIVGPARSNIGGQFNNEQNEAFPRNFDIQDFVTEDLCMRYKSTSWWENSADKNSATLGMGEKASPMLLGETINTPIAIWGRGSIFAEKSLIADEDLVVNRAATIRAQIRAKSFRRHHNSSTGGDPFEGGYCGWSFLLDNGMSSHTAPRHTIKDGGNVWPGTPGSTNTPIIIDIGKRYGKDRLLKFGYARNVSLNGTDVAVDVISKGDEVDRNICLFGRYPEGNNYDVAIHTKDSFIAGTHLSNSKNASYSPNPHPILQKIYEKYGWGTPTSGSHEESVLIAQVDEMAVHITIYIFMNYTHRDPKKTYWLGMCEGGMNYHDGHVLDTGWSSVLKVPKGVPMPHFPITKWQVGGDSGMNMTFDPSGHGTGWKYKKKGKSLCAAMAVQLETDGRITIPLAYDPDWWFPASYRSATDHGECLVYEFSYPYDASNPRSTQDTSTITPGADDPVNPDNPGDGSETEEVEECWLWDSTAAPTSSTLQAWLEKDDRSELFDTIKAQIEDDNDSENVIEEGELTSLTGNYGYATIKHVGKNEVEVSMIVTAYKSGASDLSHRSINFKYGKRLLGLVPYIDLIGTYIIGDSDDSASGDEDMTKLTTVDLAMSGITRTKAWLQNNLTTIMNNAITRGSISIADIQASSETAYRRITLFGPGGYITFQFRGHESMTDNSNWNVQVNGQITSNIQKGSQWAGCIMMFGTSSQFKINGNAVQNWICNTAYYSNGPAPTDMT